jgi:hypothetical protein
MQQVAVEDSFNQVLVRWREHRKNISTQVNRSRIEKKVVRPIQQRIGLIIFGSMFVALGIALLMLLADFRRLLGASAGLVVLISFAWAFLCMVFLGLWNLPSIWHAFFRGMDDLFAAAGTWYQRDKPFVEALADSADLDLSVIARRLKGEVEFREKLSAFLVIIAGGASFSGLGAIWDSLVKGHPNPWVILPAAGLAMTTILLQTLFIAARIKGDLLVCLEEAEELRKRRQNAPVARVDKLQSLGMTPVIKGPFIQGHDRI